MRYLAILHFLEGKTRADIARCLKVARGSVNKWVNVYLNNRLDGFKDTTNPGRPAKLTPPQLEALSAYVKNTEFRTAEVAYKRKTSANLTLNIKIEIYIDYSIISGFPG